MKITRVTRKEYVAKVKLTDDLMAIGIPDVIITKMMGDGFKTLIDFSGLTAERMMTQYDGLKFGTAHRLSLAALAAVRDEAKVLNEENSDELTHAHLMDPRPILNPRPFFWESCAPVGTVNCLSQLFLLLDLVPNALYAKESSHQIQPGALPRFGFDPEHDGPRTLREYLEAP